MQTTLTQSGSTPVVSVSGRIDAASAPTLEKSLVETVEGHEADLILDLENVDYVSSAGLSVMLITAQALAHKSKTLYVAAANGDVIEIIKLTGVDRLISLSDTVDQASETIGSA